jgi:hypothetical protein
MLMVNMPSGSANHTGPASAAGIMKSCPKMKHRGGAGFFSKAVILSVFADDRDFQADDVVQSRTFDGV